MPNIRAITQNKKQYLPLLLLADEQEDMIDRYLERGTMYLLEEKGAAKCVCVLTDEGEGVLEVKNLATAPDCQRQGYGRSMLDFIAQTYHGRYTVLLVGTGESPRPFPFMKNVALSAVIGCQDFSPKTMHHPIWEAGVQLVDMIYLKKAL